MLWLLVLLLPRVGFSAMTQESSHQGGEDDIAVMIRPHIYYCRSPNMEVFTCWWHPLDNSSESGDNVTYTLTYSVEKGPRQECPDYVTGGPNSCHFDSAHTSIWMVYCMNVMAKTLHGNYTSQDHCVDVAEIVETEAPVNLTYTLLDANEDEAGRTVMLSWVYPTPAHIQFGWITLVFELQYGRIAEPGNWKVKGLLREPNINLLDLPVGEYIARVRCRSHNYGRWSKWSNSLSLSVPARPTPDKLVALILVTGVGIMALLVIGFGVIPQGKRIKAFLLPPIPKPRIRGIDPLLLKKGSIDEINRHFITFHGYKPSCYSEEVWDQVTMDDGQCLQESPGVQAPRNGVGRERGSLAAPNSQTPLIVYNQLAPSPSPFQGSTPYCQAPAEVVPAAWVWPSANPTQPELLDYSIMATPATALDPAPPTPQDFYTCVNVMSDGGEVHLVPCLSNPNKHTHYLQLKEKLEEGVEKSSQLTEYLAKKMEAVTNGRAGVTEGGSVEQSESAVPLLPGTIDNRV